MSITDTPETAIVLAESQAIVPASVTIDLPPRKKSRKPRKRTTPLGPGADLTLMTIMERFGTEEDARAYLENVRWPNGPYCPHCGNGDAKRIHKIAANLDSGVRAGLHRCNECGKQFTVTVGTIFEDSHIPLNKWLIAFYAMNAAKTQVSALQLQRQLKIGSYRSAWFMCHRIRHALRDTEHADQLGGIVTADESYFGGQRRGKGRGFNPDKTPVVSLMEQGGRVRSTVVEKVTGPELSALIKKHVAKDAHLQTDQLDYYVPIGEEYASHKSVNHSHKEWVRTEANGEKVTTNHAEGFFGNCKRSLDGTHHNVSRKHLPLYMAELDHKYNTRDVTDGERTVAGLAKAEGKRLTLRPVKKSDGQMSSEPVADEDQRR